MVLGEKKNRKKDLLQAIHHTHEHRTQIESMLGHLGLEPLG